MKNSEEIINIDKKLFNFENKQHENFKHQIELENQYVEKLKE